MPAPDMDRGRTGGFGLCFFGRVGFLYFLIAPAINKVVIDEATGLHVGVYDRAAHEFETALDEILT